jgi:signal transduction histidine kinase
VVDFSEVLAQEASHAAQGLFQPTDTKGHDDWLTSRKSNAFLSILYQLSEKLRTLKNIDEIIEIGLAMIFEAVFSAERSMIMIKSATKGSLEVKALKYRETEPTARENVPVSHTLLNWVLNEKMVLVSQDVAGDARFNASESMKDKNVQSIICAPMIREEKVIGVVYLDSSRLFNLLTQEDAAFVAAAANELALSIENIRLQKEALRNERMAAIGMTVSNLSHNIRNLITLNQNAFDLMGRHIDKSKDAKLKKNWKWIQQGFSGIHRLAVEMLEYAKEPEVRLELADINQLILDWQASLEEGLKLDGVELELQLAPHIPNWMMDEAQCQRALLNLVMNAAHAVKDRTHPLIQLGTQINPYGDLVISVADNGCGIPRDRLNRVVELFFTTKGTQGSGLGLPMVQKFMDQMEGELKVESKENEGSIFKMIFPKL